MIDAVESHPDRVSGAFVFRGTRVPVAALFENLRDGATVDEFLEWFPGVRWDDVAAVLNHEVTLFSLATGLAVNLRSSDLGEFVYE